MTKGSELYLNNIIDNIGGKESEKESKKESEELTESVKTEEPNEEIHLALTNIQPGNDEGNPSMITNELNKAYIRTNDYTKSKEIISNIDSDGVPKEEEKTEKSELEKIQLKKKNSKTNNINNNTYDKSDIFKPQPKKDQNELIKENRENKDSNALKNLPDKDLSDNENDSLLLYINNNIDNNIHDSILNESSSSIISTLKENGKFSCYNRDMEIISNYIKNYYSKYNKYPTTKLNFYKYGRLLGKGAFGKVNLSLHVLTGRLVAIKSINKTKLINERQKRKIQIETTIMKTLSKSNNVVKIFETYETKKH